VPVVARAEERAGLRDEVAIGRLLLGPHGERGVAVGGDSDAVGNRAAVEGDRPEMRAREDRRVDEGGERHRRERDPVGTLAHGREGRAVLPALGKPKARGADEIVGRDRLRIEEELIPAQEGELRRG